MATKATPSIAFAATNGDGKMKKRGGLHALRVALFMMRSKTNKKSKSIQADVVSKGLWKRVLGSMRPMHLQDNHNIDSESPVAAPTEMCQKNVSKTPKNDSFHDFAASPISPLQANVMNSASSSSASLVSLDDNLSSYASAQNLQELEKTSSGVTFEIVAGGEDNCEDFGDEMIDARAEEFIAKFYEQMRIQQEDLRHQYNEKKKKKRMESE